VKDRGNDYSMEHQGDRIKDRSRGGPFSIRRGKDEYLSSLREATHKEKKKILSRRSLAGSGPAPWRQEKDTSGQYGEAAASFGREKRGSLGQGERAISNSQKRIGVKITG